MIKSAASVDNLIRLLGKLPGVGPKSAARLAFHVLKISPDEAREIADAIVAVKERVGTCEVCCNITEVSPCAICADPRRDHGVICVVEEALDVPALEKVEDYRGMYHVLGGRLSPLDGIGPDDIRIRELLAQITSDTREVVLATNPTVEGEATAMYIAKLIKPLGVKVTRIARGLPMGGDLEYADAVTLSRALSGRQEV